MAERFVAAAAVVVAATGGGDCSTEVEGVIQRVSMVSIDVQSASVAGGGVVSTGEDAWETHARPTKAERRHRPAERENNNNNKPRTPNSLEKHSHHSARARSGVTALRLTSRKDWSHSDGREVHSHTWKPPESP
jgi:hypothetical protein